LDQVLDGAPYCDSADAEAAKQLIFAGQLISRLQIPSCDLGS
jgi:hypothetical protein